MIEINLLPEERKKKNESTFSKIDLSGLNLEDLNLKDIPVTKIGIIAVIGLIAFHLLLFSVGSASKLSTASLTKKKEALMPGKIEADSLKNEVARINKKVGAIDELMVKRFMWAAKLNALSDAVTPGIWFTGLSYDEKTGDKLVSAGGGANGKSKKGSRSVAEKVVYRYLVLSGYASSMGEQGTALIGKFIKSLKDNAQFYSDFSEITLDSIKSDKFQDQEVMNFKITCLFKETHD